MSGLLNVEIDENIPIPLNEVNPSANVTEQISTPNMLEQTAPPVIDNNMIANAVNQVKTQAITQRAAKKTMLSGLPDMKAKQAAITNVASDIEAGDKDPGFLDGLMSGIGGALGQVGQFLGTETGQLLLSGVAGHAIGTSYGTSGVGGFVQGAGGGLEQIGLARQAKAEQIATQAETALDTIAAENEANEAITKGEDKLRGEWNPIQKQFNTIRAANDKLQSGLRRETAAGDLAGIFAYMKVLDPGSTVREGEFANAQNSAGVPDQIRNLYNKAAKGIRLAPEQRTDFIQTSQELFSKEQAIYDEQKERFSTIAKNRTLNKENVFGKESKKALPKKQKAPKAATIANPKKKQNALPAKSTPVTTSTGSTFKVRSL